MSKLLSLAIMLVACIISQPASAEWQQLAIRIGIGVAIGTSSLIMDYDFGPIDNIGCRYGYTLPKYGYDYFGTVDGQTTVVGQNTCGHCTSLINAGGGRCDKHTNNDWVFTNSDILGPNCGPIAVYFISLLSCGTYYTQCLAAGVPSSHLACF